MTMTCIEWHSGENYDWPCKLGVHYVRPQLEMGQNPNQVVRAYAIMVYRHTQSYSTVDGQLASGHNWDPKEIASYSATNNTSFVPWLLDVFFQLYLKSVVTLPGWSARFPTRCPLQFAWWIRHRFWFLLGSQTSRQFWAHPDWRCRAHERCHLTTGCEAAVFCGQQAGIWLVVAQILVKSGYPSCGYYLSHCYAEHPRICSCCSWLHNPTIMMP